MSTSFRATLKHKIGAFFNPGDRATLKNLLGDHWGFEKYPKITGREFCAEVRAGKWPQLRYVGRNSANAAVYEVL